jgi:hypothetical protein
MLERLKAIKRILQEKYLMYKLKTATFLKKRVRELRRFFAQTQTPFNSRPNRPNKEGKKYSQTWSKTE